jgi:hypothetical protein
MCIVLIIVDCVCVHVGISVDCLDIQFKYIGVEYSDVHCISVDCVYCCCCCCCCCIGIIIIIKVLTPWWRLTLLQSPYTNGRHTHTHTHIRERIRHTHVHVQQIVTEVVENNN